MKHPFLILLLCICSISKSFAQASDDDLSPYGRDVEGYALRTKMTAPPYGLKMIQDLIGAIILKEDEDQDGGLSALSDARLNALSLREKFTYVMIHAEYMMQNCGIPEHQVDLQKRIFAQLETGFDEAFWSERQVSFLKENRDSVCTLIQESVGRSKWMGVNYKEAIVEMNAWQLIPFILTYIKNTPKDKDALTLLMLLMKKGEYAEFMQSTSFQKLYGPEADYYAFLNYNKANEDLICERAYRYYKSKKE